MITHTHSDHVGSLGSLILLCFYNLNKVNIIMKNGTKHINIILELFGCPRDSYNYVDEKTFDNKCKSFKSIRYVETLHRSELDCYGLIFETSLALKYGFNVIKKSD